MVLSVSDCFEPLSVVVTAGPEAVVFLVVTPDFEVVAIFVDGSVVVSLSVAVVPSRPESELVLLLAETLFVVEDDVTGVIVKEISVKLEPCVETGALAVVLVTVIVVSSSGGHSVLLSSGATHSHEFASPHTKPTGQVWTAWLEKASVTGP